MKSKTIVSTVLFTCSFLFLSIASATDLGTDTRKAIDAAILAEMEKREVVGLAIGIIQDGEVVYTKGYGYADIRKKRKVLRSTLFRWASTAKPMTAVAALQLVESGKLNLDKDIRLLVPEFPDKGVVVTMRQLLGHLAGMPHYQDGIIKSNVDYKQRHPFEDVVVALDTFKETPLVSTPGTAFHYSTHGFILASAVIQRAGEEQFARQVQNRIAKPLKMRSLQPDYQWKSNSKRAVGYKKVNGEIVESTDTDVSWKLGAGGWISNVEDFAKFAAGLLGDELVAQETKDLMWTSQVDADGKNTGYGLGFGISKQHADVRVSHNGAQEKTRTRMVLYPEKKHGVLIMTNSEYVDPSIFSTLIYSTLRSHKNTMNPTNPEWDVDRFINSIQVIDGNLSYYVRSDPACASVDCQRSVFPGDGSPDFTDVKKRTGVDVGIMTIGSGLQTLQRELHRIEDGTCKAGHIVLKSDDLEVQKGYGVVFALQSRVAPNWQLHGRSSVLRDWYKAGIRVLQLQYGPKEKHNASERLGYGTGEGDTIGLTDLGISVVKQMNKLGMIIDVAHSNRQTTLDAAALSTSPIIASHANAEALTPIARNKSDEELRAIADSGGVICVTTIRWMLDTDGDGKAGLDDFISHIEYMVKLVGIEHVGVATDADMCGWVTASTHYASQELASYDRWKLLAQQLHDKGWTDEDLAKLLGGNLRRILASRNAMRK